MKFYVLSYCFKVWLTCVLIAPIFFLAIEYFIAAMKSSIPFSEITSLISFYIIFVFGGAVVSVITLLIFWSIGMIVYSNMENVIGRKLIMSFTGCTLTALTFLLFFLPDDMFSVFPGALTSCYCFCVGGGCLIYHFD
jgi:hypothetical protein